MSKRYSVALERAVQIELLRAQAGLQRQSLSMHGQKLAFALDPMRQLDALLNGPQSDMLRQGVNLVARYPFLLSMASSAVASRRWRGLFGLTAGAAGIWWLISRLSTLNNNR